MAVQVDRKRHEEFINDMLTSAKRKEVIKVQGIYENVDMNKVESVAKRITGVDKRDKK